MTEDVVETLDRLSLPLGGLYVAGAIYKAADIMASVAVRPIAPMTSTEAFAQIVITALNVAPALTGGAGLIFYYWLSHLAKLRKQERDAAKDRVDHEFRMAELAARKCQCQKIDTTEIEP